MTYDLIIVAKSSTIPLQNMTKRTIETARQDGADMNVIIVETSGKKVVYDDFVVPYSGVFCYNRALNLGLQYASGDIHILANNDLIFNPGWSQIGELMRINGFDSASALSQDQRQKGFIRGDYAYEGYNIGSHVTGWCLFVTKECIQKIGRLDESYEFWYSDNAYADQIRAAGIRHGLFCNVQVDHITSVTLRSLPYQTQRRYMFSSKRRYKLKNAT